MKQEKGLIHIICGDGKGKTTASVGLAVRAAGREKRVLITRFLKNNNSGELNALQQISQIRVLPVEREFGFTWKMDEEKRNEATRYYNKYLKKAIDLAIHDEFDLLILDEVMAAYNLGFIEKERLLQFLREKPEKLEIVLTGRDPKEELCELADYISEVHKVKHPYEKGIPARIGIEY